MVHVAPGPDLQVGGSGVQSHVKPFCVQVTPGPVLHIAETGRNAELTGLTVKKYTSRPKRTTQQLKQPLWLRSYWVEAHLFLGVSESGCKFVVFSNCVWKILLPRKETSLL